MSCRSTLILVAVLAGTTFPLPTHAAPRDGRPEGGSFPSEVRRLLGDAERAELDGDSARREALLHDVLAIDPNCNLARWQLGEIEVEDGWQSVSDVQRQTAADPRYAEYIELRGQYGLTGEGHLALARWCKRQGLAQEAGFHWAAVLTYQSNHEEALRELGKQWVGGRLVTYDERVEMQRARREARKESRQWSAKLAGWERAILGSDLVARTEALSAIRSIDDPHAILALEEATLAVKGNDQREIERSHSIGLAFTEALDAMEGQSATDSLTRHAVYAPSRDVRYAAIDALKGRSHYAYVPQLLDALSMPIESSFYITTDRNGSVYYYHELFREGVLADSLIESQLTVRQVDHKGIQAQVGINQDGEVERFNLRRESDNSVAKKKTRVAAKGRARFANAAVRTEQQVARENQSKGALNSRVATVLERSTGQDYGTDPRAWWDWWQEYNEYDAPEERTTYEYSYVDSDNYIYRVPSVSNYYAPKYEPPPPGKYSCFAAGTLVWTKSGQRPIESLEIGELVLSQEIESGELCFQPVIGRTLRPPSEMLKLAYAGEALRTTLGHPLWVAGEGWQMAKEIDEGNVLHTVGGPVSVDSIEPDGEEAAYNLVVANTSNYFVGQQGVLVHDNTPRPPTQARIPGWIGGEE